MEIFDVRWCAQHLQEECDKLFPLRTKLMIKPLTDSEMFELRVSLRAIDSYVRMLNTSLEPTPKKPNRFKTLLRRP